MDKITMLHKVASALLEANMRFDFYNKFTLMDGDEDITNKNITEYLCDITKEFIITLAEEIKKEAK